MSAALLLTAEDATEKLRAWCKRDTGKAVAKACGVSPTVISLIVNGHRPISPSVFLAMGYRKVVRFEPIGGRP